MINLIDIALAVDSSAENFAILCRLIIDGRPNCFLMEDHLACLNVDGLPWMMIGTETEHGTVYEFVDDEYD